VSRTDQKIAEIIGEELDLAAADVAAITPETKFIADLGMDSLDVMSFAFRVEEVFELKPITEVLKSVGAPETVGDLAKYIESEQLKKAG
jgi:acyl carrier protein